MAERHFPETAPLGMPDDDKGILGRPKLMLALTLLALLGTMAGQLRSAGLTQDPDSLLRIVSVRDMLAGQGWFDTVQARVLPPDGLDLHWSRMLDAVLAGLVYVLSLFLPPATAEQVVVVGWPVFLLALFALTLGALVRDRFGIKAASLTMLVAVLSQLPRGFYFQPGMVDHHNLQLVLMACCGWGVLASEDKAKAGFLAGAAVALSLAIGLEGIGFFAVTFVFLILRFVLAGEWEAERLGGFGIGLALLSPVFFVMQTPLTEWTVMKCDVLAPPALAATTVVGVGSFLLARVTRGSTPQRRAGVAVLLAAAIAVLLAPVMLPCRGGPYNMVPLEVQRIVIADVTENQPLQFFLEQRFIQGIMMGLPFLAALLMLAPTLGPGPERDARLYLFALALFGLAVGFLQARMMIWGWALMPAALGVAFGDFIRTTRINLFWVLRLLVVMSAIFPYGVALLILQQKTGETLQDLHTDATAPDETRCTDQAAIELLNQLAPAILFNPTETGPALLHYTHHSVTGASYHRSPKALEMGVMPFLSFEESVLKQAVADTNADYIVLCKGHEYGPEQSMGTRLSKGDRVDWLTETPVVGAERLLLLKVAKPRS